MGKDRETKRMRRKEYERSEGGKEEGRQKGNGGREGRKNTGKEEGKKNTIKERKQSNSFLYTMLISFPPHPSLASKATECCYL